MASDIPSGGPPVTSVAEAITRMQHIEAALPAGDGIACFNRMYLEVTQQVDDRISQGFFVDPAFMSFFDVTFANVYFAALDMLADEPTNVPAAWQPLFDARSETDIYPIQLALAGMNAHINHDLPIALVDTCTEMKTAPDDTTHHADYQKVDVLLDAAERSIRRSFESSVLPTSTAAAIRSRSDWKLEHQLRGDVAWDTALALWQCRNVTAVEDLLMNSVARTVAMASRCLLTSGEAEDRRVQSAGTRLFSLFGFELRWRG